MSMRRRPFRREHDPDAMMMSAPMLDADTVGKIG
jgi:hypothetical protein